MVIYLTTLLAPNEGSVDAVIASTTLELENIFSLKDKQRMAVKAFLDGTDVSALFPAGFGNAASQYG